MKKSYIKTFKAIGPIFALFFLKLNAGYPYSPAGYKYSDTFIPEVYLGIGPQINVAASKAICNEKAKCALSHGGGFYIFGGLKLAKFLALELKIENTIHDKDPLSTFDWALVNIFAPTLNIRLFFETKSKFILQALIGGGVYLLGVREWSLDAFGTGFYIGPGFDYEVTEMIHVELSALYQGVKFSNRRLPGSFKDKMFANFISLQLGISLYFSLL
jgi:hypothetical protein